MPEPVRNIGASARARLLAINTAKGLNFDVLPTYYAVERLLYRLAQSRHADRFVLKGAILLKTWFNEPFRVTHDHDLQGLGDPAPDAVLELFREDFGRERRDGVLFGAGAARVSRIQRENDLGDLQFGQPHALEVLAWRAMLTSVWETRPRTCCQVARLSGFARHAGTPAARWREVDRGCPGIQAMVDLGLIKTRMMDNYDL